MRAASFLSIFLICLGCSGAARKFDRGYLEEGIRERTGHSLGPGRSMPESAGKKAPKEAPTEAAPEIPPTVDLSDGLEPEEAVEIALWRSAELQAQMDELGISRADLLQAGLLRNPTYEFLFPVGKKELELTVGFPLELTGGYFFRKKAAAIDLEATAKRLIHAGVDFAAKVRTAYAAMESILLRIRGQEEIIRLFEESARLTEIRSRLGEISAQEARLADLEVLRSRGERSRLLEDLAVARERLNLLMGLDARRSDWEIRLPAEGEVGTPAAAGPSPPENPEEVPPDGFLVKLALEQRLDARAAELEIRAAAERVGLARASAIPVIGVLLDANASGGDWQVGPGLSGDIPIFDFNQGGTAKARAELQISLKRAIALRDRIAAEVREAREVLLGERRRETFLRTDLVPKAEEALRAARRAFELGEESALLVLEISRKVAEAKMDRAEAMFRARSAEIELERSLGGRYPIRPSLTSQDKGKGD